MRRALWVAVTVGALVVAACGDDGGTTATAGDRGDDGGGAPPSGEAVVYEAEITVLESPEHGPQLCQVMATSYPPQCGGPDVVDWDWDTVEGEESANGTTWGHFHVTGTWDPEATALTVTEPATVPDPDAGGSDDPDEAFATPCPRPAGGWAPVDPATTNQAALDAANGLASARPGTAGVWLDQAAEPGWTGMNDPSQLVLNVTTTGDAEALEADIRGVWGGALCVSPAEFSGAELQEIADSIQGPNVVGANALDHRQLVTVDVYVPDDEMQADLDERYGEGVVDLVPWLTPVA